MEKEKLLQLYSKVVKEIGFKEGLEDKGWMPKLGPDDYRSIIRYGETKKGEKAVITVSPHEDLIKVGQDFHSYRKCAGSKKAVVIPAAVLASGQIFEAQFLVQESIENGERILSHYPLSTTEEKEEVAVLYWNTVVAFAVYHGVEPSKMYSSDYFVERLNKWMSLGRECQAIERGFIDASEKDKAVRFIFTNLLTFSGMEFFFSHFSNTDIVKRGKEYFIWDATIISKPEAFGIASWIWGATLYAYNIPEQKWFQEINEWIEVFSQYAPENYKRNLKLKIRVNLAERFLGALLVDLPLRRSPFHRLTDEEVKKAHKIVKVVFQTVLEGAL